MHNASIEEMQSWHAPRYQLFRAHCALPTQRSDSSSLWRNLISFVIGAPSENWPFSRDISLSMSCTSVLFDSDLVVALCSLSFAISIPAVSSHIAAAPILIPARDRLPRQTLRPFGAFLSSLHNNLVFDPRISKIAHRHSHGQLGRSNAYDACHSGDWFRIWHTYRRCAAIKTIYLLNLDYGVHDHLHQIYCS